MNKKDCAGTYYVSGYTRADGIEVSGYTRTCGAAHNSISNANPQNENEDEDKMQRRADILYSGMKDKKRDSNIEGKTINGVSKGQPMSFEEAGGGRVNPIFNPLMTNSYSQNCQSCVAVFEARLRGYDIQVGLPKSIDDLEKLEKFKENPNMAYRDIKTGSVAQFTTLNVNNAQACEEFLNENIQIGERYILAFNYRYKIGDNEYEGHVVNMWKDKNGELKFYDPQCSKYYDSEYLENVKFEFSKFEVERKPRLLRIDDKELNFEILNIISQPAINKNQSP